ncbi:unnamed protein product [Nesidiocoris tenuis]|uniref:Uncharacterized protein n=1 Tax=Nesidiocoris tenuis TaxID=355587 RepID=A0A6H5GQL5_9HEMI|nr:unnamed protein product [Nesidiocoris tenuis]
MVLKCPKMPGTVSNCPQLSDIGVGVAEVAKAGFTWRTVDRIRSASYWSTGERAPFTPATTPRALSRRPMRGRPYRPDLFNRTPCEPCLRRVTFCVCKGVFSSIFTGSSTVEAKNPQHELTSPMGLFNKLRTYSNQIGSTRWIRSLSTQEGEAMSSRVSQYIKAVRLEQHVLNSSDPLLEGGRARPGQLRLSGEKPTPGTVVHFTFC